MHYRTFVIFLKQILYPNFRAVSEKATSKNNNPEFHKHPANRCESTGGGQSRARAERNTYPIAIAVTGRPYGLSFFGAVASSSWR